MKPLRILLLRLIFSFFTLLCLCIYIIAYDSIYVKTIVIK
uniref:Uncharacterized protein n=1 Tax=Siphoviridae sp. cthqG28 TaxID=2826427 RepID=A0A8S5LZ26_9CAUD|nr:MAG TPA: hypothetical protein [Siphoviridae sp. cthqG28]DAV69941.1 MAG TPA: hypothetical protein [Caudoviricetes sp.]DAZ46244.1 MAG TPA: hypothetical protein [Caudoviricetes sp.]